MTPIDDVVSTIPWCQNIVKILKNLKALHHENFIPSNNVQHFAWRSLQSLISSLCNTALMAKAELFACRAPGVRCSSLFIICVLAVIARYIKTRKENSSWLNMLFPRDLQVTIVEFTFICLFTLFTHAWIKYMKNANGHYVQHWQQQMECPGYFLSLLWIASF